MEIRLKKANWGNVSSGEIKKVLGLTAQQFVPFSPLLKGAKIDVSRTQSSPIVLHARGKGATYQVKLNTRERFWTQYVFQFAHELGHIICGYKKEMMVTNGSKSVFAKSHRCTAYKVFPELGPKNLPTPDGKVMPRSFLNMQMQGLGMQRHQRIFLYLTGGEKTVNPYPKIKVCADNTFG